MSNRNLTCKRILVTLVVLILAVIGAAVASRWLLHTDKFLESTALVDLAASFCGAIVLFIIDWFIE